MSSLACETYFSTWSAYTKRHTEPHAVDVPQIFENDVSFDTIKMMLDKGWKCQTTHRNVYPVHEAEFHENDVDCESAAVYPTFFKCPPFDMPRKKPNRREVLFILFR